MLVPVPVPILLAEVELGRQRRGRRLSPSPTAPAPHRPQGKRKAPEERDKARAAQLAPRHSASPGMETQSRMETGQGAAPEVLWGAVRPDTHPQNAAGPLVKAKTVKKPESTDIPRTSRASGECQNTQGSLCLCSLFAHSHGQGTAHPTKPLLCLQPSRQWLPRCREQWPWQVVRCPSAVGPLRASSLNMCWIQVSTAQPHPAQFSPQIQELPSGRARWGREDGAASGLSCRQLQDRKQSWGQAIYPSCLRGARGQEQKPQPEAPCPAQGMPKCSDTPPLCFRPNLVQLTRLWWGVAPAWHHSHGLGVSPSASSSSSCLTNRTGNPNCTPRASCQQPLCTARTLCPTR